MSQIIEVPGHGQVEFPDGMSDAQIVAAIKANAPQQIPEAALRPEAHVPGMGMVSAEASNGFNPAAALIGTGRVLDRLTQGVRQAKLTASGMLYNAVGLDNQAQTNAEQLQQMNAAEADKSARYKQLQDVHPGSTQLGELAPLVAAPMEALPIIAGMEYGTPGERAMNVGAAVVGNKIVKGAGQMVADRVAARQAQGAASTVRDTSMQNALEAGYKAPPSMANPSLPNQVLEGFSGGAKTEQAAARANEPVTNNLVRQEFGLPPDTPLSPSTFDGIRSNLGQAYEAVKNAIPVVKGDQPFYAQLYKIAQDRGATTATSPNAGVSDLLQNLSQQTAFETPRLVEEIKRLRFLGSGNAGARDPVASELGKAQLGAATAIEDMIDRNLQRSGTGLNLIKEYRAARVGIAKSYSAEKALNESTGSIDAASLWRQKEAGVPLSGNLDKIANAYGVLKSSMAPVNSATKQNPFSVFDSLASGAASTVAAIGGAGMSSFLPMSGVLARPAVRYGLLSGPYQRAMLKPNYDPSLLGRSLPLALNNSIAPRLGGLLGLSLAEDR